MVGRRGGRHAHRQHPGSAAERSKVYERLKRRRTRTIDRLRELIKTVTYDKSDADLHYMVQALKHGDNHDAWEDSEIDWEARVDDELGEATE